MLATCARDLNEFGSGWTIIDTLLEGPDSLTGLLNGFGLEKTVKPSAAIVSVRNRAFLEIWLTEHPRPYSQLRVGTDRLAGTWFERAPFPKRRSGSRKCTRTYVYRMHIKRTRNELIVV